MELFKKMKNILLTLFIGIFLISSISALEDTQLIKICGGDNEIGIVCFGGESLIFLAGLPNPESRGGPGGPFAEDDITTLKEPEEIQPQPFLSSIASFFGIRGEDIIFFQAVLILFFICLIFFLLFKRRKKNKEKQKENEKNRNV